MFKLAKAIFETTNTVGRVRIEFEYQKTFEFDSNFRISHTPTDCAIDGTLGIITLRLYIYTTNLISIRISINVYC